MKRNKLIFCVFLMVMSMVNPGCSHQKTDAKAIYQQYISNKLSGHDFNKSPKASIR